MTHTRALPSGTPSLLEIVAPQRGVMVPVLAVLLGSLLLAVSAKVQVAFWPVPMTMQTMVVILLGMAYGSRLAVATVGLYLMEGLAGLPVFAGAGAGPAYMAGPTAGYLVGFLLAAGFTGWLADRGWGRTPWKALAGLFIGHLVVFVPGLSWMTYLFGLQKAVALGLTPFIAATILKTLLGAALLQLAWKTALRRS